MNTFKERLLVEQQELNDKIDKLSLFINSENFKNVDFTQKGLLKIQICAMETYSQILFERISLLSKEN